MTTEEKSQLLLIDLCARLPYDTIVSVDNGKYHEDRQLRPYHLADFNSWVIRPYLRPMSSMTKEEKKEYDNLLMSINDGCENTVYMQYICMEYVDWLNKNKFDYRGLIPMGLALPAPEGMYEIVSSII